MDDDELTNRRLVDVLVHLAREYANVTNSLCADVRVPKDLRDELAAHTAEVLGELPAKIHRAVDPTYGLEDAKVDWAGRAVQPFDLWNDERAAANERLREDAAETSRILRSQWGR